MDLVWKLDLPFGDAVTGPQYLLGRAARAGRASSAVFNGEGGDQLFGGWTSKPMIAAAVYADLYEDGDEPRGDLPALVPPLLRPGGRSSTRPSSQAAVGGPGQRRALLRALPGRRRGRTAS